MSDAFSKHYRVKELAALCEADSQAVVDLCVEVLSPDNTKAEMERKRKEYFSSGCRLVWELNPRNRTADVFTNPDSFTRVESGGVLDGGDVLPGFTLPLAELFAEFDDYFPSESNDRA